MCLYYKDMSLYNTQNVKVCMCYIQTCNTHIYSHTHIETCTYAEKRGRKIRWILTWPQSY